MSVYSDFEQAWAQRFPGCELPKQWEDDVRANLSKHKQKVALLNEELEKESFYVQYLETLLADVERVNSRRSSSDSAHKDNRDQYVTVITVSSNGDIESSNKSLTDNPLYQSAQSLSLEETSHSTQTTNASTVAEEQTTSQLQKPKKKRPPTPPRKPKVNRLPSLNLENTYENSSFPNTPEIENSKPISNLLLDSKLSEKNSPLTEQKEIIANVMSGKSENVVTDDSQLYNDDEDNIYDTVAPDEPLLNNTHADKNICSDMDSNISSDTSKYFDVNCYANYVNIDYFLRRDETSSRDDSDDNDTQLSQSLSSDHEIDESVTDVHHKTNDSMSVNDSISSINKDSSHANYDEVFEPDCGELKIDLKLSDRSETLKSVNSAMRNGTFNKRDAERLTMHKCIIASIIESETIYVDCLNTSIQYMKALNSTIGTAHPLLSSQELTTIFYKIPELYSIHWTFLEGLKKLSQNSNNECAVPSVGDLFKVLASRLGAYSAFLKNYTKALETINKCSAANNQFSEITRSIKILSLKGQSTTLEDLLHKPVARVQKNALVLHDLLKYTNEDQNEYKSLKTALKMTQCFLNDLNIAATEQNFPVQDKTQRRLVKESFIVEYSDGKRKLRHLFLFNDVLVCAKYKASAKQKFTFDLKWYILLNEITVIENENDYPNLPKDKDNSSEILNIKSRVCNTRDLLYHEEKEKSKSNAKILDKLKKKRSEMEAQLVLLLPHLSVCISHKTGKHYVFYLSSEYERNQWFESIKVLQHSAKHSCDSINHNELQAWIETCRKNLNPSLGSFLLRSSKDEDLFFGDLYLTVHHLKGLSREADIFFCVEVDTYGHFFQRAMTAVRKQTRDPHFEQEFVLDLEGTQTLRILCYEEVSGHQKPFLRGKANIELSHMWLNDNTIQKSVPILDCVLTLSLRYVSCYANTSRMPASKVCGAFGLNVQQVCKKEKSSVPYIISGCVREVERRGMKEVGIYRVSGLSSDVQRLKKAFETNAYEADLLIKEVDIHAVTGLLKLYLRELQESLFTNGMYKKYLEAFNMTSQSDKSKRLLSLFTSLAQPNQNIIVFIVDHLCRVNKFEEHNKMSLHNLATIFGPTMLRQSACAPPSASSSGTNSIADSFTAGTIDVMAQAGILYFFLKRKSSGLSLTNTNCESSC